MFAKLEPNTKKLEVSSCSFTTPRKEFNSSKSPLPLVLTILLGLHCLFNFRPNLFRHPLISHLTTAFLGRFLANMVELSAANFGAFDHFNLIYHGRIEGKNLFYTYPRRYVAYGESGARFPAVLARKHQTFKSLQASFTLLDNLLPDTHGISRPKIKFLPFINIYRADYSVCHLFVGTNLTQLNPVCPWLLRNPLDTELL